MTVDQLKGTQLVVVKATQTPDCLIYAYEKKNGIWTAREEVAGEPGKTGKKGVKPNSEWWSWYTPAGYFGLGPAMGAAEYEETGLDYRQIKKGDHWVDDQKSKYYNKFYQESWNDKDWYGSEDLYDLLWVYYYCIVIQYNMDPIDPALDCAIFFHVKKPDTEEGSGGCVTAQEWVLQFMFRWLDKNEDPHILIY